MNVPTTYADLLTQLLPGWRAAHDAAGGRWKPNQPDGTYSPPDPIVLLRALRGQPQ